MQVVYEDDHIACVVKPQGMPTTSRVPGGGPCAAEAAAWSLRPAAGVESVLHRPAPAHRLDAPTGVVHLLNTCFI